MRKVNKNTLPLLLVVGLAIILTLGLLISRETQSVSGGDHQLISPSTYQAEFVTPAQDHILLDVRTAEEFNSGHIAGAQNIALQSLPNQLDQLPQDQPIVVYCRSGNRSAQAARLLIEAGYTQVYDLGGILDWTAQGYPLQ